MRDRDRLYAEVAGQYGAALERLARAYERDADKRRDLLQEIHIALWRSLARFDGRCSTRTWVYRVAHNVATSHDAASTAEITGLTAANVATRIHRIKQALARRFHQRGNDHERA